MPTDRAKFKELLFDVLLPDFCAQPHRNCHPLGFRPASIQISEEDAHYFLMAWESGLVRHQSPGRYVGPIPSHAEGFFWDGLRSVEPRPFTLWLEPVITFGSLARLHHDHGWPADRIGTQSFDGAFDTVAYKVGHRDEHVAGEVKKARREVDDLVSFMSTFGADPSAPEPDKSQKKGRNAFRKMAALRKRKAPVFWALGPEGYSRVFLPKYLSDGVVELNETGSGALDF